MLEASGLGSRSFQMLPEQQSSLCRLGSRRYDDFLRALIKPYSFDLLEKDNPLANRARIARVCAHQVAGKL
jgi:hypothetical protein